MVTITHPEIPGAEVEVPESSLPHHQAAGWVVKDDQEEPAAAVGDEPEDKANEQTKTPKRRVSSTKDGE
jgi:hypothetical protein